MYTFTTRQTRGKGFFFSNERTRRRSSEGEFSCERNNHLGNVLAVISDKVNLYSHGLIVNNQIVLDSARATVVSASDYYPGGMLMKGRNYSTSEYRYGFGGFEMDNEVNGEGNHLAFGENGYDPITGRRWNLDPLASRYPYQSPYSTFNCNPILYEDPTGKSGEASINKQTKTITVTSIYVFYGGASTPELAKQSATNIQKAFNDAHGTVKIDGVDYKVQFKIVGVDANSVLSKFDKKAQEVGVERVIGKNNDSRMNFVRLENETDYWSGTSYTDATEHTGANTGYWSTDQMTDNKGTTESHEYNHGLGGLYHPEELNPNGGNNDKEPSIDMTTRSADYAKSKYLKTGTNGSDILDVTKRQVRQKNISAIFTKEVVSQLKTDGKANVGKISNEYHKK